MAIAKAVIALALLLALVLLVTFAVFRYFDNRAEERHELQKMRRETDQQLLLGDTQDDIDRELEKERKQ